MVADKPEAKPDATLSAEPKETPTYTQEDLNKAARDARSAVMADASRARQAAEAALSRLTKLQQDIDEAEAERFKDDPDQLVALREKQKRRQLESDLATVQSELNQRDERLKQFEAEKLEGLRIQNAQAAATKHNVDAARLLKLAKFTDGSPEAIEDLAKELSKKETKPPMNPDSGKALGGSLTWEQVRDEYIKNPRGPYREQYLQMRAERKR